MAFSVRKSGMIYLAFRSKTNGTVMLLIPKPLERHRRKQFAEVELANRFSFHSLLVCICLFMHMSNMIRLVYSNFICAHSFFLSPSDSIHLALYVCVYVLVYFISIFSTSEGANKANMLIKTETRFQEFSSFDIKVNRRENLWTIRAQWWRIWFLVATVSWIFRKRYINTKSRACFDKRILPHRKTHTHFEYFYRHSLC